MGTVIDWEQFWGRFDDLDDMIEEEFQDEMVSRFGEGLYYFSDDERWKRQQQVIQKLVNEELAK